MSRGSKAASHATELAPMSTTEDPHIALKYTRGAEAGALIFMLRASSFMQQGADLVSTSLLWHIYQYGAFMQEGAALMSSSRLWHVSLHGAFMPEGLTW